MPKFLAIATVVCLSSGCATQPQNAEQGPQSYGYTPVVDLKGKQKAVYEADLKECRALGDEAVARDGTGLGRAFMIALLVPRRDQMAASYASRPSTVHMRTVMGCLMGRGYIVLG